MNDDSASRAIAHDRVRDHSPRRINERVDRLLEGEMLHYVDAPEGKIAQRVTALDYEWDIDRALMVHFAIVGGASLLAGARKDPRWLAVSGAQMAFLLMHATVGWCPPAGFFRRLGFRTHQEIERERNYLANLVPTPPQHGEYAFNEEQA